MSNIIFFSLDSNLLCIVINEFDNGKENKKN